MRALQVKDVALVTETLLSLIDLVTTLVLGLVTLLKHGVNHRLHLEGGSRLHHSINVVQVLKATRVWTILRGIHLIRIGVNLTR